MRTSGIIAADQTLVEPVLGPTVWAGADLDEGAWLYLLRTPEVAAMQHEISRLTVAAKDFTNVAPEDFQSPVLAALGAEINRFLMRGPGFVVLRGWDVREYPGSDLKTLLWGLGSQVGRPRHQNPQGERVHVVADTPMSAGGSTGHNEIFLHTENARPPAPPRVIALMCLNAAAQGGQSVLMSGHSVHNRLLAARPETLLRLYADFAFGRHREPHSDGKAADLAPVFRRSEAGLAVRYGRYWIDAAAAAAGVPLDAPSRAAIDAFDEVLRDESLALTFMLAPGDVLIAHNQVLLHGRKEFVDGDDPNSRRRLLRLWLD